MAQANEARQAEATRQCPRCHGSRIDPYPALERFANAPCKYCDGHGTLPVPNVFEDLARIKKRDRIVAEIVLQARMNPKVTWAQWAKFLGNASTHYAEAFIRSCGEQVSETTLSKTWPLAVAVVQSWADSDTRVLAFEARR